MNAQPSLSEHNQLDLFAEPERKPWRMEDDYLGWQARFLRELAERPCVACYPGFTGAMHEALVGRGHATREDAGFLDHLPYVEGMFLGDKRATPKSYERWRRQQKPHPQFRYTITEAGRAILSTQHGEMMSSDEPSLRESLDSERFQGEWRFGSPPRPFAKRHERDLANAAILQAIGQNIELGGAIREAAQRVTGGNCTFVDDDIAILEHLATRAVQAGLTDGLHPTVAAKASALHGNADVDGSAGGEPARRTATLGGQQSPQGHSNE